MTKDNKCPTNYIHGEERCLRFRLAPNTEAGHFDMQVRHSLKQ